MAITNSALRILQGMGIGSTSAYVTANSTTIASNAVTVTAALPTAAPASTINFGYVRVKASNVDGTHAITTIQVTLTDGTTTITLAAANITEQQQTNGRGFELLLPFASDLNINSATAVVTGAAGITTLTVDVELMGN